LAQAGGFGGGGGGGVGGQTDNGTGGSGAAGGIGGGGGGGGGGKQFTGTGGPGGLGGWGGGGGAGGGGATNGAGGAGGFGGGGGTSGYGANSSGGSGSAGFGGVFAELGGGGAGAAFGAGVFVRSGHVTVNNSSFTNNQVTGGTSSPGTGQAKGAAIFALASLTPPNGNTQGYPATRPTVDGCLNTFSGSIAANAGTADSDNVDTFGTPRSRLISSVCDRLFIDGFESL